ncbi:MAG: hypothetical protein J2P21_30660 [Chloracidobacterium sp.]|nr:hypothetical protein [Chloracidobacterium sp.]
MNSSEMRFLGRREDCAEQFSADAGRAKDEEPEVVANPARNESSKSGKRSSKRTAKEIVPAEDEAPF